MYDFDPVRVFRRLHEKFMKLNLMRSYYFSPTVWNIENSLAHGTVFKLKIISFHLALEIMYISVFGWIGKQQSKGSISLKGNKWL